MSDEFPSSARWVFWEVFSIVCMLTALVMLCYEADNGGPRWATYQLGLSIFGQVRARDAKQELDRKIESLKKDLTP